MGAMLGVCAFDRDLVRELRGYCEMHIAKIAIIFYFNNGNISVHLFF